MGADQFPLLEPPLMSFSLRWRAPENGPSAKGFSGGVRSVVVGWLCPGSDRHRATFGRVFLVKLAEAFHPEGISPAMVLDLLQNERDLRLRPCNVTRQLIRTSASVGLGVVIGE